MVAACLILRASAMLAGHYASPLLTQTRKFCLLSQFGAGTIPEEVNINIFAYAVHEDTTYET